jgi:hypothetical protein
MRRSAHGDGTTSPYIRAGLFGEPLDEAGRVLDLAARLGERLALLAHHDRGEIVAVREDQVEPAAQALGAHFCSLIAPGGKGRVRSVDRLFDVGCAAARHRADAAVIRRVANLECHPVASVLPFAADQNLLPE